MQRVVLASPGAPDDRIAQALAQGAGELVFETVVAEGAVLRVPTLAFAMALVPARDGLRATLDGKTVYVTPDDLLVRQVYDRGLTHRLASAWRWDPTWRKWWPCWPSGSPRGLTT